MGVTRMLLARGADPNIVSRKYDWKSPLSLAVTSQAAELVKLLLSAGADPNIRDAEADWDANPGDMTPLMRATTPEIANLLLQDGADPTLRNNDDDYPTAVQYIRKVAAEYGRRTAFGKSCIAAAEVIEEYQKHKGIRT